MPHPSCPSDGLIVPPGCVIVFSRPLRPLNGAERREQRDQITRADALRRNQPPRHGLHLVARIDEDGRDLPGPGRYGCAMPIERSA